MSGTEKYNPQPPGYGAAQPHGYPQQQYPPQQHQQGYGSGYPPQQQSGQYQGYPPQQNQGQYQNYSSNYNQGNGYAPAPSGQGYYPNQPTPSNGASGYDAHGYSTQPVNGYSGNPPQSPSNQYGATDNTPDEQQQLVLQQHRERFSDFDDSRFQGPHEEIVIYRDDSDAKRCRDPACAIFFILQLIATLVFATWGVVRARDEWNDPNFTYLEDLPVLGKVLTASLIISVVFSFAWLFFVRTNAGCVIYTSLIFNVIVVAGFSVLSFALGIIATGVMFLFFTAFAILYIYCIRRRIAFTKAMVQASVTGMLKYPGIFAVSALMSLLSMAFAIYCFLGISVLLFEENLEAGAQYGLAVLAIFFLYWSLETFGNVNHVATAGVIGTWWYLPDNTSASPQSLRRACTTSLGSIAFGSLLVALLQTLRAIIRSQAHSQRGTHRTGGILALCCLCILYCFAACIERFIRFFNVYAYSQIGLYGKDYITAARDTFDLLIAKGFSALINDDLTSVIVGMGSFLTALFCTGTTLLIFYLGRGFKDYSTETIVAAIYITLLIGFWGTAIMLRPIKSAVITTFVVYAEDPQALQQNRPAEYQAIDSARSKLYY